MEEKKLKNVYAKLQRARALLQKRELKKSGTNSFSKYNYFELSDFLYHINEICDELGLFTYTDITEEIALLNIINTDEPTDSVVFSIPSANMELKGGNAIQNIGAVQTYMRRYLYMSAFEIAESDIIDQQPQDEKSPKNTQEKKVAQGNKSNKQKDDDGLEALLEEVTIKRDELAKAGKRKEINEIILMKSSTPNIKKVTNKEDLQFILDKFNEIK
ncbi:MAG: ERF family protein [Clostridium sp.]